MGAENCGLCRFFKRSEPGNPVGFCRGRTPTAILVGMGQNDRGMPVPIVSSYFPQIPDHEWCGDFSARRFVPVPPKELIETTITEGAA